MRRLTTKRDEILSNGNVDAFDVALKENVEEYFEKDYVMV